MHAGIRRSIVDEYLAILICNPTIGEDYVHHITDILRTFRYEEISTWFCNHLSRILKRSHVHIEHIAETAGTATNTVSQMQPALISLDRMRPLTVLHLLDGMIVTGIDDLLFLDFGMSDIINKSPTDTTTRTCIDETILWTGIESILAINKLRMENHIALLALGLQVRKALPVYQVLGTGNGCSSSSSTEVARLCIIMTLCTEHAIDVAILMSCESHIIDVGSRNNILRHGDRLIPETEVVNTIRTLCHGKETLAVSTLYTNNEEILTIPLDGTRIERSIHHDALHEIRIALLIEVVTPLQWCMFCGEDWVLILFVDTISPLYGFILTAQQFLIMSAKCFHFVLKCSHNISFFTFLPLQCLWQRGLSFPS